MRWCSWWSRGSPSSSTWRGRLAGRCGLFGAIKSAMRAAGWWRSVERCYGAGDEGVAPSLLSNEPMERPMKRDDLSRSLVAFDQNSTLVSVVELGLKSWLVGGLVPGVNRQPLKKQKADPDSLLALLIRWRHEAIKAGHTINRVVVAFEAGYDGFWLARWLRARGIEAYVIHPTSIPVSREQRRAKTDRLDTA